MKKQKVKKYGNRNQRDYDNMLYKAYGLNKNKHTNIPLKEQTAYKFPRLQKKNYINQFTFEKAHYPFVMITDLEKWEEIHSWLKTNISIYTWTGHIFWFTTETDKNAFMKQFKDSTS